MTALTFENIRVEDLNQQVLDAIRAYFKSGHIQISVKAFEKKDNLDSLLKRNAEAPFVVRFEDDFDFDALVEAVENDPDFDVMAEFEKRKMPNPRHAVAS